VVRDPLHARLHDQLRMSAEVLGLLSPVLPTTLLRGDVLSLLQHEDDQVAPLAPVFTSGLHLTSGLKIVAVMAAAAG